MATTDTSIPYVTVPPSTSHNEEYQKLDHFESYDPQLSPDEVNYEETSFSDNRHLAITDTSIPYVTVPPPTSHNEEYQKLDHFESYDPQLSPDEVNYEETSFSDNRHLATTDTSIPYVTVPPSTSHNEEYQKLDHFESYDPQLSPDEVNYEETTFSDNRHLAITDTSIPYVTVPPPTSHNEEYQKLDHFESYDCQLLSDELLPDEPVEYNTLDRSLPGRDIKHHTRNNNEGNPDYSTLPGQAGQLPTTVSISVVKV